MNKRLLLALCLLPPANITSKTNDLNIYVNSIPKCGTHLLTKCVELLTKKQLIELPRDVVTSNKLPARKNNEFFATHVCYSKKAADVFKGRNYKTFLIYRDPRDKVVSRVFFTYSGGFKGRFMNNPSRNLPFNELLARYIKEVNAEYEKYLPWTKDSSCCAVKFENLIGPRGGGSLKAQTEEIRKIAKHLGVSLNSKLLKHCSDNLFGDSVTFRKGVIGSWKKYFTKGHTALFKKVAGPLLIKLGYERNTAW